MLLCLKISNFALIEDVTLTFDKGMSVLTGETGSGKSVIVTALALAVGDRAEREHIRHGSNRATVEATFSVERMNSPYKTAFADYLVDGTFTVVREILRDGSSKVRINGNSSTLARLKELTSPLAEILGQHSSRLLLDEENHLTFLDSFAGAEGLCTEVTHLHELWEGTRNELRRARSERESLERERELLLFQKKEISDAHVRVGEEDELIKERRILDSSRTLIESAGMIESALCGEDHNVIDLLRLIRREIDKMAAIDASLLPQVKQTEEVDYQLEDLRGAIEKYGASIPDDPQRLEEINARLDELYRLKRKYGGSEDSILQTLSDIEKRLVDRRDVTAMITQLETQERSCRGNYTSKALQLSDIRRKAAKYLQKLVVKEMTELAIDQGQFDSEFLYEDQTDGVEIRGQVVKPHPYGLENCRFLFSANPGEPLKSLVKTASGGEVSRLLLAIKAAEMKNNERSHSLLVFDEVDAGIGGKTAVAVGAKIRKLARNGQVIVITHLHQIARQADHHYVAEKTDAQGKRVTINVVKLDGPAIAAELDRMVALPE
ncbi:MAG: DNA repair protein RecN [candidate division Zixibacteria bacterium]|nr:DNA repair protein RecN [candidate division Zixibacteria bacterium]